MDLKAELLHMYEYVSTIVIMVLIPALYLLTMSSTLALVAGFLSKPFFGQVHYEKGYAFLAGIIIVTFFYEFSLESSNLSFNLGSHGKVMARVSIESTILFCTIGGFVYLIRYVDAKCREQAAADQVKQKEDEQKDSKQESLV